MRTGRFKDALVTCNKAFELLKINEEEFKKTNDLEIVESKFHLLSANVNFILANYADSCEAALAGIKAVDAVKSEEPDI